MSKGRVVTAIRGDPQQTALQAKLTIGFLSEELEHHNSVREASTAKIYDVIDLINLTTEENQEILKTRRDRAAYLRRAIQAGEDDHVRLGLEIEDLKRQEIIERQIYDHDLELLTAEQADVQDKLKTHIQLALQQLKSLREFQDHKHQLDVQRRQVTEMIAAEKKQHAAELTDVHFRLEQQREFYEQDLARRLAIANKFAEDFADLHLDVTTQRIADETKGLRDELKADYAETYKHLQERDKLSVALKKVQQTFEIRQMGSKKAQKEATQLKIQAEQLEAALVAQVQTSHDRIRNCREEATARLSELRSRVRQVRDKNVDLKQVVAEISEQLAVAEEGRFDNLKREWELLNAMNDAAVFVLTSLDEKFGQADFEEDIRGQRTALNQIIRKLASLKLATAEVPHIVRLDRRDVEVQTEKPGKLLMVAAPPFSARIAQNPRMKGVQQSFRESSEYQRVFRPGELVHQDVVTFRRTVGTS